MSKIISSRDEGFNEFLQNFLIQHHLSSGEIAKKVSEIISDVRKNGDQTLLELTKKFDNFAVEKIGISISKEAIRSAYENTDKAIVSALHTAHERILAYSHKQLPEDKIFTDAQGITLGWKWNAIERVGIYVPGGLASYPSSVLMNASVARAAGVKDIAMVVPTPKGELNDAVLAAAHIVGINEIYRIGGAQAIAALAYGTETISKVDKIVGPGNAYVAEAKRQVYGVVGIDMIAGPSEILVIADDKTNPDWIAADLLSQAEHDSHARSVLITFDNDYAMRVQQAVENLLRTLPRAAIAQESWQKNGLIIVAKNLDEAASIANRIAPEHLEVLIDEPEQKLRKINSAGAIFLGRYTPEAIGDYMAGPSHVLPTAGGARFSSGLSVFDFLTRSSIINCSEKGFAALANVTEALAKKEGLDAHALSVSIRSKK